MKQTLVAVAVMTALFSGGALAQAAAPAAAPKAAPKAARPPQPRRCRRQAALLAGAVRLLLKERLAQGGQDTPELRNAVREELNTRELLAREAKKAGLDKNAGREDADGPRVADRAGARLRHRLGEEEPGAGGRAAQGIRHDQGPDRRQGIQGPPHPRREGRRGEGRSSPSCRRARSSTSSPSALEGPGLEGQRRRPRLERAGELRQAVRRRDEVDAEGQVHGAAGADAVRLARDRGRGRPRREGAGLRRSEAAAAAALQAQWLDKYFKDLRAKNGV